MKTKTQKPKSNKKDLKNDVSENKKRTGRPKKSDVNQKHVHNFFFYGLIFVAILTIFNFIFYIVTDQKQDFIKFVSDSYNNSNSKNNPQKLEELKDLEIYNQDGVSFYYPKTSKIISGKGYVNIDNWSMDFYKKRDNYSDFDSWFKNMFGMGGCVINSLSKDKTTDLSYSLYFVDGSSCSKSGLYLVGDKMIGNVVLGSNPDGSYEQVLGTIKF